MSVVFELSALTFTLLKIGGQTDLAQDVNDRKVGRNEVSLLNAAWKHSHVDSSNFLSLHLQLLPVSLRPKARSARPHQQRSPTCLPQAKS